MGIPKLFAEMIVREHIFRPLAGEALVVGRQTVEFKPDEITSFMQGLGAVPAVAGALEIDKDTRATEGTSISDRAFFRLLGLEQLKFLDVTDYEKADIIHDLSDPLPDYLLGVADVVVDGATLDNVFNPAQALISLAGMLRPGGRVFLYNVGSDHTGPYTVLTPLWFYDYFVGNGFPRVLVYASVFRRDGGTSRNVFVVEPQNVDFLTPNITSVYSTTLLVLAERGPVSTQHYTPVQHQYRPRDADLRHRRNIELTLGAHAADLVRSDCDQFMATPPGYRFVPQ